MCLKKLFRKKCQKVKFTYKWSLNMNISLLNGCLSQLGVIGESGLKMLKKTTFLYVINIFYFGY